MPRVVHFEIHADDPQRAIGFYGKLFGWKFDQWGPQNYWLITTGPDSQPGINGGLVPRRGAIDGSAVTAYVCTVEVESIEAVEETILELGGSTALARQAIPGVGWLFYARETEGNIFGLHQPDPNAT